MQKKTFKQYLLIYLVILIVLIILILVNYSQGKSFIANEIEFTSSLADEVAIFGKNIQIGKVLADLFAVVVLPVLLVLVTKLIDTLFTRGEKKQIEKKNERKYTYDKYLDEIFDFFEDSKKFIYEDYRRFRSNSRFQESLHKGYLILIDEQFNEQEASQKLTHKYDKQSKEYSGMLLMVEFIKKKRGV